jgi:hypothetical protein
MVAMVELEKFLTSPERIFTMQAVAEVDPTEQVELAAEMEVAD